MESKTFRVYMSSCTNTTELMDEFTEFEEGEGLVRKYNRMILTNYKYPFTVSYRKEGQKELICFKIDYIIEFPMCDQKWYSDKLFDITMSDLKARRTHSLMKCIVESIPLEKMQESTYKEMYLPRPFLLRAQCSYHKKLLGNGLLYGDTNEFAITGVIPGYGTKYLPRD